MSYAIYAESDSYVHLVTAETSKAVLDLLIEDMSMVGVGFRDLKPASVYAVIKNVEDIEMQNRIFDLIKKAQKEV